MKTSDAEPDDPRYLWPLLALFWIGSVAATMAQVYGTRINSGGTASFADLVRWILPGYLPWLAGIPLVAFYLSRRFRFGGGRWRVSVPVHIAACLLLASATLVVDAIVLNWNNPRPDHVGTTLRMARAWGVWLIFTYAFLLALLLAIRHSTTAAARRLHALRLEAALAHARLAALRSQLQPHFLFNALNSASSLIGDDPRAARQMIARLAELLRVMLADGGTGEWSLRQELQLLERYTSIERVRFGERLTLDVACDHDVLDANVPTLLLQPLVENAIQHGIQPSLSGGTVRVAARRENGWLALDVSDDGVGLSRTARERVGLSNTRERLETCYPGSHSFAIAPREPAGTIVTMRIPFASFENRAALETEHAHAAD